MKSQVYRFSVWLSQASALRAKGVPRSRETAPPPLGVHRALSIVILQGPRGALFLMSEVPLNFQLAFQEVTSLRPRPMVYGSTAKNPFVQGHFTYKKTHLPRTIPYAYA